MVHNSKCRNGYVAKNLTLPPSPPPAARTPPQRQLFWSISYIHFQRYFSHKNIKIHTKLLRFFYFDINSTFYILSGTLLQDSTYCYVLETLHWVLKPFTFNRWESEHFVNPKVHLWSAWVRKWNTAWIVVSKIGDRHWGCRGGGVIRARLMSPELKFF